MKALTSFAELVCYLYGLPSWVSRVLAPLLVEQKEDGSIVISARWRKDVGRARKISESGINQAINLLIKAKVLERHGVNYYSVREEVLPRLQWDGAKLIVAQMKFRQDAPDPVMTVDVSA
jgi:hypothetical protein